MVDRLHPAHAKINSDDEDFENQSISANSVRKKFRRLKPKISEANKEHSHLKKDFTKRPGAYESQEKSMFDVFNQISAAESQGKDLKKTLPNH